MVGVREDLVAVSIVFLTLPTIFVTLRFSARIWERRFGADDWLLIPAIICLIGCAICMLVGAAYGNLGQHQEFTDTNPPTPINDEKNQIFEKSFWILQLLAPLANGFTKLSLLCLYRRLFGSSKTFRRVTDGLLIFVTAWIIAMAGATLGQCSPPSVQWKAPQLQGTKCVDVGKICTTYGTTDILTDAAILCLPLPMVWRLNLPTRKKWSLSGLFLLGFFVTAFGSARLASFLYGARIMSRTLDFSYYTAPIEYWTVIEVSVGIICTCLPTIPSLVRFWTSTVLGLRSRLSSSRTPRSDDSELNAISILGSDTTPKATQT